MTPSSRTYIDPPESLRDADHALIKLKATLQALGTAYMLGNRQAITTGLSVAIGHADDILYSLRRAHDRSTR